MAEFSSRETKSRIFILLPFIIAIVLVIGLLFGYIISNNFSHKPSIFVKSNNSKIDDILEYTEIYYVDTVDKEQLEETAIEEFLSTLDPHSFYIDKKELVGVEEDLQGNFEGIGVEFSIVDDTIIVVTPIVGGPSEEVGVMAGDKIIEIEDSLVAGVGVTNMDVMKMLKGPKNTEVSIGVARGNTQQLDFTIERDKIPLYSVDVSYIIDNEIGYVKINRFSATTHDEFQAALKKIEDEKIDKLIIDLRQNPGGYMHQAVQMADELLGGSRKLVVYTEGKSYKKQEYFADRPGYFENGDLAILIDQNSASASEILAGAIQDWDRGLIIGRRSFGKGLVQEQFQLADGSALRLTIARYYTPSGRSIQKPYDNTDEYYGEIYSRFEDGSLYSEDSVELNDSTKYYTLIEKREVYGGGGIKPDIFVPLDTSMLNIETNQLRQFIPQFIYGYYGSNSSNYEVYNSIKEFKNKFIIDDEFFNQFLDYARSKDWESSEDISSKHKNYLKTILKAFLAKQIFQNEGYYTILNEIDPVILEAINQLETNI